MTIKPIIMQPESVRAILDGRKTQTRRIVKNVKDILALDCAEPIVKRCPHQRGLAYDTGDLLWVREAWAQIEGPAGVAQDGRALYRADACDNSGRNDGGQDGCRSDVDPA